MLSMSSVSVGSVVAACVTSVAVAQTASFSGLGHLPGYERGSIAVDVSADGTVVAGTAMGVDPLLINQTVREACWWDGNGVHGVGRVPGTAGSSASALSCDGHVLVGSRGPVFFPCKWDLPAATVMDLGVFEARLSPAASCDGSRILIGPQIWTATEVIQLRLQESLDMSSDGRTVFGLWRPDNSNSLTVLAIQQPDRSLVIPPLSNVVSSGVTDAAMSGDGLAVAANSSWWRMGESGARVLAMYPRDLSDDGGVVVGTDGSDDIWNYGTLATGRAVVWKPSLGPRPLSLECVLDGFGVPATGWRLISVRGCSDDGLTLVGVGVNPDGRLEAWRATIPRVPNSADINGSGDFTVQDIFDFLSAYFAGDLIGDFNGSGSATVQDIFDFLAAYFAGCP